MFIRFWGFRYVLDFETVVGRDGIGVLGWRKKCELGWMEGVERMMGSGEEGGGGGDWGSLVLWSECDFGLGLLGVGEGTCIVFFITSFMISERENV